MYLKKLKIGNVELKNNIILAPMAGITDLPFRTIAKKYLEKSVATEMTISLDIVMPNYGLNDALLDGRLYKHANQTRLAYVCSFNNEAQTKIYIDCTTGEAIGTSRLLGGEF